MPTLPTEARPPNCMTRLLDRRQTLLLVYGLGCCDLLLHRIEVERRALLHRRIGDSGFRQLFRFRSGKPPVIVDS